MGIPVKATKEGYYGRYRVPGDTFEVAHVGHVGSWMERLNQQAPTKPPMKPGVKPGVKPAVKPAKKK